MATNRQKQAARRNIAQARQAQSARAHGENVPGAASPAGRPTKVTAADVLTGLASVAGALILAWLQRARLNASRGIREDHDSPQMNLALARLFTAIGPAIAKLETFGAEVR